MNQQKDKKKQKGYKDDILHNLLTDYQAWLNLVNLYKESMMVRSLHILYPSLKDMDCFPLIQTPRFFQNLTRRMRKV